MSFIPYQIDYQVAGTGKTLGITKKRITFKFGFANRQALTDRLTGSACRGSEHEVVLIMSLASGKRNVLLDGREIHFSQAEKMARSFDYPFTVRIPGIGAVDARLISDHTPGPNPYHFYINGMSYFHFSKIYELGTPAMRVGQLKDHRSFTSNSELEAPPEERRLIAQAKLESLRELRTQQEREQQQAAESKQMNRDEGNLINFDDDVAQAPPSEVPRQGMAFAASSITLDPAFNQSQSYGHQEAPAPTGAAYQNYSLNTSQMNPASQYGYGAPNPSASTAPYPQQSYSQQSYSQTQPGTQTSSMLPQYSQPPASYAPSPYDQTTASYSSAYQPQQQQQQSQYGYPQQSFQAAPPPTYEETQMAFGSPSPAQQQQQQQFATPTSQASYGSAPAFAQPPRSATGGSAQQPGGAYGAYPNSSSGW